MQIHLPKITRPLALTDYAPELIQENGAPIVLYVWVNPPRAFFERHDSLVARSQGCQALLEEFRGRDESDETREALNNLSLDIAALGEESLAWYAELWSQHPDEATHWTADEVRTLAGSETDPGLYGWLTRRSLELIGEHRSGHQKK